ncbi:MAG: hypothetical protein AB1761_18870 [Pseudomonadota bacterium]
MAEEDKESLSDLERRFYQTLTWYFEQRPTGFYNQFGLMKDQLIELNKNLKESSTASDTLARALNRLTLVGVVVAGLGVLVAAGHLVLEIVKYVNGK